MSINSINQNTDNSHYLQKLVVLAKERNSQAIDELCLKFKPLIYKEARRETVYKALGEDAVNIAWEIFLRFIYQYRGSDYVRLPGLIQCHIHFGLINYIKKQGLIWDNEVVLSDCAKENLLSDNTIEDLTLRITVEQLLNTLTPVQRNVLRNLYFNNANFTETGKLYNFSRKSTVRYKLRSLKALKKQIA